MFWKVHQADCHISNSTRALIWWLSDTGVGYVGRFVLWFLCQMLLWSWFSSFNFCSNFDLGKPYFEHASWIWKKLHVLQIELLEQKLPNQLHWFICCVDFLGINHAGILVHWAAWERHPVPFLVLWRAAELLLDDWLLQPAGLPDCYETGGHCLLYHCYPLTRTPCGKRMGICLGPRVVSRLHTTGDEKAKSCFNFWQRWKLGNPATVVGIMGG